MIPRRRLLTGLAALAFEAGACRQKADVERRPPGPIRLVFQHQPFLGDPAPLRRLFAKPSGPRSCSLLSGRISFRFSEKPRGAQPSCHRAPFAPVLDRPPGMRRRRAPDPRARQLGSLRLVVAEKRRHRQLDGLERLRVNPRLAPRREHEQIALGRPAKDAQRLIHRIDDPVVRHAELMVKV